MSKAFAFCIAVQVRGVQNLMPDFGLPMQLNIFGPSPLGDGVWQAGGLGFRWDDALPMQN
jgi:taurine dioxygenase